MTNAMRRLTRKQKREISLLNCTDCFQCSFLKKKKNKKILFIYFTFGRTWSSLWRQTFSSCGEQGLLFLMVLGLLISVASLIAKHRL